MVRVGSNAVRTTVGLMLICAFVLAAGADAQALETPGGIRAAERPKAPRIKENPRSALAAAGTAVVFSSEASGTPTPTAQWESSSNGGGSWSPINGATMPSYSVASVTTAENGRQFRVTYKNDGGVVTSKAATLEVYEAPVVTKQPASQVVLVGENAKFEAAASGFPTPSVHWEQSSDGGATWTKLASETTTTLTVTSVTLAQSGRLYRATFANVGGEVVTQTAELVVHAKPAVTSQPVSATVEAGGTATFTVQGTGVPTPTIQWQDSTNGGSTWSNVPGATEPTLTIAETPTSENGFEFRAVLTNVAGTATSSAATLSVYVLPQVTGQPSATLVEEGQTAVFEASASGFPAASVQWEVSTNGGGKWSAVPGATSTTLTLANVTTSQDGYLYRARFTNTGGTVTSEAAKLSVDKLPAIAKQPQNLTLIVGHSGVLEASATGYPTPTVQWELSVDGGNTWSNIAGATSQTLSLTSVSFEANGYEYRAAFTNKAGTTYTRAATLSVWVPPHVTQQPEWVTVTAGESATFEAAGAGYPTPTVQWERSTNGGTTWVPIPGATSDTYTLTAHLSESGYLYRAVFVNGAGSAASESARLTVARDRFQAVAWGSNVFRQLGNGLAITSSDMPMTVTNLPFVKSFAAGGHGGVAVLEDGTVHTWGSNEDGQLGDGSSEEGLAAVPVKVPGLGEVKAVAAGENHFLALLSNGTVAAWGAGESGQLGNGKHENHNTPVAVPGLSGVTAIAAAGNYSMALLSNGTVKTWGENASGQLGNGSFSSSDVPQVVKGVSGASAIAAGQSFAMALVSGGKVDAWGNDAQGEVPGAEIPEESEQQAVDKPVEVPGLTGIAQIAAGESHALALSGNGSLYGWGQDTYGELANGTTKAKITQPTLITDAGEVAEVAAGGQFSLARLKSGHLESWGINKFGTLGDGEHTEMNSTPVAVRGLGEVKLIAAGDEFALALAEPLPSVSSISPMIGGEVGGTSVTITGVNLADVTSVMFGATPAASFTVNSATSITAVSPAGTGMQEIEVATPDGQSPLTPADRFTYQGPAVINSLSAKSGPAQGETKVVIKGSNFTGTTAVEFGTTPASSFVVESDTTITAYTPASTAGTYSVHVTNTDGRSPGEKARFKFIPSLTAVTPASGPPIGGNTVTLSGTGFAPGPGATVIKFGNKVATEVECASQTSCTAVVPAHEAGTVTVQVIVNRAKSALIPPSDEYTYSAQAAKVGQRRGRR